jgi:undecaprenyl diphosphate synthase
LLIRTSGEQRLSNFLLWESAYSMCWTTPVFWPDFRAEHLQQALDAYAEMQWHAYSVSE